MFERNGTTTITPARAAVSPAATAVVAPAPCAPSPAARAIELARAAERAQARAVLALSALEPDAIASERAMPAEMALSLETSTPRWQIRRLLAMAEALRLLPVTAGLLSRGTISYGQAEAICWRLRTLDPDARRQAEDDLALLCERTGPGAEPDALLEALESGLPASGADRAREARAEERAQRTSFLSVQPALDGSGSTLYGALDAGGTASLCQALDARARLIAACAPAGETADPAHDDPEDLTQTEPAQATETAEPGARVGARARAEALVAICQDSLGGHLGPGDEAPARTRARARMLVSLEVRDLAQLTDPAARGAGLLWGTLGRGRLSAIATSEAACDAIVQPVVFDGARPVAVGDARGRIPAKVRTAVTARDGGCRFPGCRAPVAWSDIHHIASGAGHDPANLVMLCRRCHTRVHRRVWRISHRADGLIAFTHRGRSYSSAPRARPLRI